MANSVKTSKYYGVSVVSSNRGSAGDIRWRQEFPFRACFKHGGVTFLKKNYKTEREAATAVDLKLIELGMEPRNILKKK